MFFLLKIILIFSYYKINFLDLRIFCHKSAFDTPKIFKNFNQEIIKIDLFDHQTINSFYVYTNEEIKDVFYEYNKKGSLIKYIKFKEDGSVLFINKYKNNTLFEHIYYYILGKFKVQNTAYIIQGEIQMVETVKRRIQNDNFLKESNINNISIN